MTPHPTGGGEGAYYNEVDPFAAAWLRELIAQGHIAPGVVDERDIRDVRPDELSGFVQCHFFAGIGVWSYALRCGGWPDDLPVWTGSCPCQPFSAAGGRKGFADERHLWPAWFHLIEQCEPQCIFGEQVAGGNVDPWLDLVQADLEGMGYAFGLCPAPAAGFGAPHIRERAFWMADAHGRHAGAEWEQRGGEQRQLAAHGDVGGVADAMCGRAEYASRFGLGAQAAPHGGDGDISRQRLRAGFEGQSCRPGPVNGFWRASDWIHCTDGKWRPVEPGTFPLAHGAPARVGRLRGYGNAIAAPEAVAFVEAAAAFLTRPLEARAA